MFKINPKINTTHNLKTPETLQQQYQTQPRMYNNTDESYNTDGFQTNQPQGYALNNDGKVDLRQFDLSELKKKYSEENYKYIFEDNNIYIVDKEKNILALGVRILDDGFYNIRTMSETTVTDTIIAPNGDIGYQVEEDFLNNTVTTKFYNNGMLDSVGYEDNKDDNNSYVISYKKGKPAEKYYKNRGVSESYLAQDFINLSDNINKIGIAQAKSRLAELILQMFDEYNIITAMSQIQSSTEKSIYNMIDEMEILSDTEKQRYKDKIDELLKKYIAQEYSSAPPESRNPVASSLAADIDGADLTKIENDIMQLNKDNIAEVLSEYTGLSAGIGDYSTYYSIITNLAPHIIKSNSIISQIQNNDNIPDNKKEEFINHIMNVMKECTDVSLSDIADDMYANRFDSNKSNIDARRLKNRVDYSFNPEVNTNETSEANGLLDNRFDQGNINDCWLISSIITCVNDEERGDEFRKKLESCLTYNEETGDVTVNLEGFGISYTVSKEERDSANHLSSGDKDVRAIEIALDRYIKEQAYAGDIEHIDTNFNIATTFFNAFFGNGVHSKDVDVAEFNNPNMRFALGNTSKDLMLEDMDGNKVDTSSHHEYSIVGSDENYVYIKDPRKSSVILRSPIEHFVKQNNYIDYVTLT